MVEYSNRNKNLRERGIDLKNKDLLRIGRFLKIIAQLGTENIEIVENIKISKDEEKAIVEIVDSKGDEFSFTVERKIFEEKFKLGWED